jgi:hypothetical protein
MRKLMGVVGALAAATLAGTALPAQASTFLGNQTFKSVRTGNCIADLTEGLRTSPCNSQSYQSWGVYAAPNVRAFKNVKTGRCIQGGWDARVVSVVCQGSDYQRFNIVHYSDGSIAFRNVATSGGSGTTGGNCITVQSDASLKLAPCNGTSSQRFK